MGLVFKYDLADGIAQMSYLVGDDDTYTAAIIDPRPDCEVYLDWARREGLAITHILETHNHADFMSGARELAAQTDAEIYLAPEEDHEYNFEFKRISNGDKFVFGGTTLTARHTPGHTAAHMSFELAPHGKEDSPLAVFSGDSLFVNSAGRPDLADQTEELAENLYKTLYDYYMGLDDGVIIYPGHGKGSACGPAIGDPLQSTVGYERRNNPFLQFDSLEDFKKTLKERMPLEPTHYRRLKKLNAAGPPVVGLRPHIRGLPPKKFWEAAKSGENVLIDTRSIHAFGGGHVPGAINIADRGELSAYAGWMLDPEKPLLLVVEDEPQLDRILALFMRTGFVRFAGYLSGGMKAWDNSGLPLGKIPPLSVHDIHNDGKNLQILDVRMPSELEEGRIPKATHFFVGDMREKLPDLDKGKPVAVYCSTGYRASIAASILKANGFEDVQNVPGSWTAWQAAGYPAAKKGDGQ